MRPFARVEAKIIFPRVLSIKSGKRTPITKYFGSTVVLSRGMKIASTKKYSQRDT